MRASIGEFRALMFAGGKIRKTWFATVGMMTAAAICYPHQAVDIAQTGWHK